MGTSMGGFNKSNVFLNKLIKETYDLAEIIQEHIHNNERWLGSTAGVGPGSETSLTPFRVTSAASANTFGTPIVVFDGTETPIVSGMKAFDMHRMQIIDAENNAKTYRLRLACDMHGLYTSFAAAVAAGAYTDIVFKIDKANNAGTPIMIKTGRTNSGSKVWAALATLDAVAQYIDFIVGLHEYDEEAF